MSLLPLLVLLGAVVHSWQQRDLWPIPDHQNDYKYHHFVDEPDCSWQCLKFTLQWPGAFCLDLQEELSKEWPSFLKFIPAFKFWELWFQVKIPLSRNLTLGCDHQDLQDHQDHQDHQGPPPVPGHVCHPQAPIYLLPINHQDPLHPCG
ncbi:unnamed protein product [Merluccius merluccius]